MQNIDLLDNFAGSQVHSKDKKLIGYQDTVTSILLMKDLAHGSNRQGWFNKIYYVIRNFLQTFCINPQMLWAKYIEIGKLKFQLENLKKMEAKY